MNSCPDNFSKEVKLNLFFLRNNRDLKSHRCENIIGSTLLFTHAAI